MIVSPDQQVDKIDAVHFFQVKIQINVLERGLEDFIQEGPRANAEREKINPFGLHSLWGLLQ